jgi:hypothetical protein
LGKIIFLDSNSLKSGNLKFDSELRVDLVSNLKKIQISSSIGFLKDELLKKVIIKVNQ